MKNLAFLVPGFILLLSSCGPGYDYEKQYEFQDEKWAQSDTLEFTFAVKDTLTIYNLYLEIEHTTGYGYQNLYTQVYTRFPSGKRIGELLSLELADKAGVWLGNCNSESCVLKIPIQEGAYFNQAGEYAVTVKQYMRMDPVEGIRSIGFMLEDTGQKRGG
ncbi:MAG: gliding motility lipoprotein GldH [Phaeodactylibacter sp.]|nr:gliding motility lipoprotein GldH [Phaeodactylibacter sp.]MCB9265089.1 gliding motility lipoprotein GldH [Lewinellaceae bacterium]MCB9287376.1 gliding motility lipoprotein GldH [Lewinellaceae bacterium]